MKNPSYIPVSRISKLPIQHTWNDWDPFEPLDWPDEDIKKKLRKTSNNGITCFALGCAEWVVYRLLNHLGNQTPTHYLEAFWLFAMGVNEALPPETDHEQWQGVILGPINLALMSVLNTIYLAENGPPVQNAALVDKIVQHVLPDDDEYSFWREDVLQRLTRISPRDAKFEDGIPLPRQVLDNKLEVLEHNRLELMETFFDEIDFQQNPFLQSIDKKKIVLKKDFED